MKKKYFWGILSKQKDEVYTKWFFFSFLFIKRRRKNHNLQSIEKLEQKIDRLSKFVVIKECFPEIINQCSPSVAVPCGERGNRFINYFLEWRQEFRFIRTWIDEIACSVNSIKGSYQSNMFSIDDWYADSNKLISISRSLNPRFLDEIISMQIQCSDPSNKCIELCQTLLNSDELGKTVSPNLFAKIISFHIAKKREHEANELCKRFLKHFGRHEIIKKWLAVAEMMDGIGVRGYEKEANVYRKIEEYNKKFTLGDIVKNKRIAVVGNGPQENGLHKGSKIDSYDVVIRMNDYNLSEEYKMDYGEKVTVWSRIPQEDPSLKYNKGAPLYRYIAWPITSFPFESDIVDQYAKELNSGDIIISRSNDEQASICRDLGLLHPSSGICLIYSVKKVNPTFSYDDCFGFSFKEDGPTKWLDSRGVDVGGPFDITIHNLELERQLLRRIFGIHKKLEV